MSGTERQRLLIVCLGNICRSPMAEGALRARLEAADLGDRIEVDSAGLGENAQIPDPYTRNAAAFERTWRLVDAAAKAIVERVTA